MNEYVIYTDSSCDLSGKMLADRNVGFSSLTFRFNDSEQEFSNDEMPIGDFYKKMKEGGVAKTAAVNATTFATAFERILNDGKDILYIGFSSGLSTTYNSARIAAEQLKKSYPDRKIITVDTLCASAGIALLVDLVIEKKEAGDTIEEAAKFAEENKMSICHWFTVDDLVYLKRGGRVSSTAAFVGNMLGIKPVLHVDNEGHLVNVSKVRGRKPSILALADKYNELAITKEGGTAYISHSDCMEDAKFLADTLESKYKAKVKLITDVGPVIGAHSGPGTLALFFVGKER